MEKLKESQKPVKRKIRPLPPLPKHATREEKARAFDLMASSANRHHANLANIALRFAKQILLAQRGRLKEVA